ncbi:MAG TPA: inositol monophosphatase family protein [Edaphocola sp.]|nr:inositol monophosphatase family protein [Edaphocola sp.]
MPAFEITLKKALRSAGALVLEKFRTQFTIEHKDGINNLVTEVDKASELLIRNIIREDFPDHGIIGEEFEQKESRGQYNWVIDPIDGTANFAHGIPICATSIGLIAGDEILMGGVYNPMMNEFFFAEKGRGAFLNDQPVKVSENADFQKAFLVTGFPYHLPEGKDITQPFRQLVTMGLPVRRFGAAAIDLCWVACGRLDGFWEWNLQPWDIAAGYLILAEAGGRVTDFQGNQGSVWDKETLATNGKIHDALRLAINQT